MKRKNILSLAALTAIMATLAMPSAFAATDTSSASVDVTGDTTLTISLGSDVSTVAFEVAAAVSEVTDSHTPASTTSGKIEVVDYTGGADGNNGHHINVKTATAYWANSSSDNDAPATISVDLNDGSTTSNREIQLNYLMQGTGSASITEKDTDLCTVSDNSGLTTNDVLVTPTDTELVSSTITCPSTVAYFTNSATLIGPLDGFYAGSASINAEMTLVDGQSS